MPVGDVNSTARGSGARFNDGKTPWRFLPLFLLAGIARVFHRATTRPQKPYPMWNWAKGMPWSVPYECALRHLDAWYRGEDVDPDTGEDHLDHVLCNLVMLKHYRTAYPEGDDRPHALFPIAQPHTPPPAAQAAPGPDDSAPGAGLVRETPPGEIGN